MKAIILSIEDVGDRNKVRISLKDSTLLIEANKPIPYDNVNMETTASRYSYLYSRELPLTEPIRAIRNQFEEVDFHAILSEPQEFDGRGYHSLNIRWDDFGGVSLTIKYIASCMNHEVIRIHKLLQGLFSEINMEEWYVAKK